MKLRTGILVANTETPVGDGINGAVRAVIKVDDVLHAAIVKRIPLQAVLAECFCGMLFRAWDLPTPEPILIHDGVDLLFASLDAHYPNLKKHLGFADTLPDAQKMQLQVLAASIVCSWEDTPKALAADEAIANADRNLGNFLWDGIDHAYIDHERTLGLVTHERNIIALLAQIAGKAEEIERSSVAAALVLDTGAPSRVQALDNIDFAPLVEYVEQQLQGLANRVLARFPKSKDLLTGLEPSS
ncbi:hypothetical protein [Cupriavidus sp. YAF13]|uniref:hypothetical protein n=1 Tax=Cupriavidus sp. YAF13 TaxID=3233075 RepID=UPI003F93688B